MRVLSIHKDAVNDSVLNSLETVPLSNGVKPENIGDKEPEGAYETIWPLAVCRGTVQYQAGACLCGNLVWVSVANPAAPATPATPQAKCRNAVRPIFSNISCC